jgi:DNA ligase-1
MSTFRPMLASNVELDAVKYPVLCTPKFDGIRCVIRDGVALSRKLKPIPNSHVQALLSDLPDNLDGELMLTGKTFNQIQSAVMREDGNPRIVFHVFDIVDTKMPYNKRVEILRDMDLPSYVKKVLPVEIHDEETLKEYEREAVEDYDFEGIMIRSPKGPYKFGRSTAKQGWLCKLKRFTDAEARIVGYEELMHNENEAEVDELGLTKRSHKKEGMVPAGTLGAWIVENEEGQRFKVATGMTAADRAEYWEVRDEMIGQLVKYKFQESGGKDLPRFPVFLGIRSELDMD